MAHAQYAGQSALVCAEDSQWSVAALLSLLPLLSAERSNEEEGSNACSGMKREKRGQCNADARADATLCGLAGGGAARE